jgi:hypothetical protein
MRESENLTDDDSGPTRRNRASFFASALGHFTQQVLLDLYAFYQPVVTDWSNARASVGSNLDVALVGQLALVIGFRFAYNSEPAPGVENDDMWLRTGLRFNF